MATFGVWVEGSQPKSKSFYVSGLKIATCVIFRTRGEGPKRAPQQRSPQSPPEHHFMLRWAIEAVVGRLETRERV